MCVSVRGRLVCRLASQCGSVLMMHLLVSNDSGHMAKPRAAGLFDVTEHMHTYTRTPFLGHVKTLTCTLPYSAVPGSGSLGPPLVLWWLVLMSLPNDLARFER